MKDRTNAPIIEDREFVLALAVLSLRQWFVDVNAPLPEKIRVGVGFSTLGKRGKSMGECHVRTNSADDTVEIFISPRLSDIKLVVQELLIQLIHASAHNNPPKKVAAIGGNIGFEGPKRNMVPTRGLAGRIADLVKDLPKYPHAALTISGLEAPAETKVLGAPASQIGKSRLLKLVCLGRTPNGELCDFGPARAAAASKAKVACAVHGVETIRVWAKGQSDPREEPDAGPTVQTPPKPDGRGGTPANPMQEAAE